MTSLSVSVSTSGPTGSLHAADEEEDDEDEDEDEEEEEEDWLDAVWCSLLAHGDNGHVVMESRALYSVFKRRHELKYTALEISDTRGQSFLFSLGTVGMAHHLLGLLLNMDLPKSIFRRLLGNQKMQLLRGVSHMYVPFLPSSFPSLSVFTLCPLVMII